MARRIRDNTDLDLSIDPLNLDVNWREQSTLRRTWGEILAQCQKKYLEAEANVSIVEAKLSLEIRKNPEKFDIPKQTEDVIKSAIHTHKLWFAAKKKQIDAREKLDYARAAVAAIDQRKSALRDSVSLWLGNYNADPKARPEAQKLAEEWNKQTARSRAHLQDD